MVFDYEALAKEALHEAEKRSMSKTVTDHILTALVLAMLEIANAVREHRL